ncbi:hypothetical protein [Aliikangiella sp. G2MR2-5]|uniref:hypothetical protein n=1 Tax=Aliikangiella sp. G2MR2-5 TaxID=2788943 RepID=UPI0018A94B8A|nr:hypothetical protein [Aliikangiella sp. G2MR2-5]
MKKQWVKIIGCALFVAALHSNGVGAAQLPDSDWYLHVDIASLKNSQLREKISIESQDGVAEGLNVANQLLGKSFVNNTRYLTAWGDIKDKGDKSIFVQGSYAGKQSEIVENWKKLGLTKEINFDNTIIYHGFLNEISLREETASNVKRSEGSATDSQLVVDSSAKQKDLREVELFAAFLSESEVIVSLREEVIKQWLRGDYTWKPQSQGNLFEIVVDVEKSMMHGGVNLEEGAQSLNFESISAEKLKQVSGSYRENGSHLEFQLGLKAADMQSANKILAVVNGVLALKVLAENDPVALNLLNSIQISQDAESLLMKISGPVESFKALLKKTETL